MHHLQLQLAHYLVKKLQNKLKRGVLHCSLLKKVVAGSNWAATVANIVELNFTSATCLATILFFPLQGTQVTLCSCTLLQLHTVTWP